MSGRRCALAGAGLALLGLVACSDAETTTRSTGAGGETPITWATAEDIAAAVPAARDLDVGPHDWPQWGGTPARNNAPRAAGLPVDWSVGRIDSTTGAWTGKGARNVRWATPLGSQSYGNPVVANGRVYVGTNNDAGYVERYPPEVDLGVLLCIDTADGAVVWQHSSEKLPTGSDHDWPEVGICASPLVDGERLWYVTSRCEVVCLDTAGFHDGENDGPFTSEANDDLIEADVVWVFDMMGELGVWPHNMANCSVTAAGDMLFVVTSNGTDENDRLPAPEAPSFLCLDRTSGAVLWSDATPGGNILHGQWSSPAYAVIDGTPQVIFAGGDGWLYGFLAGKGQDRARLLWRFDCNPKGTLWKPAGGGDRNAILATPVVHEGRVYIATGQDPSHGQGDGILWCVDPSGLGDVSPTLVYASAQATDPLPPRRTQSMDAGAGEVKHPNPGSAVVWQYSGSDLDGNGKLAFEEKLHRSTSTVAIRDGLLVIADLGGVVHCLDAATGKAHWTHDLLASVWGSALIADGRIHVGDADGMVTIFDLAPTRAEIATIGMDDPIYGTPIVANDVLYIMTSSWLCAIAGDEGAGPE